jgi:enoyl-CoA hydratase/carnithine racemase
MVQAVLSRVVPRQRISKAMAKEATDERFRRAALARQSDAPESANSIPTRAGAQVGSTGAFIRPIGNSRRVFLLDPHLKADELEGLAHRIQVLTKNEGINSVLIATDDRDDAANNCLPSYFSEIENPNYSGITYDMDPVPGHTWHVAGGYDPLELVKSGQHKNTEHLEYLLDSVQKLAIATRGHDTKTRVPVITLPHGAVNDGGYALCMGSYVLATPQTFVRVLNPSRGLSFDPIGFSFLLPRLGWEYSQRSAKYPGCGMIMALTGYQADANDLVETGLATHLVSNIAMLPLLEQGLETLQPWNLQGLVSKPRHYYGQAPPRDVNAKMRNVSVAHTIDQLTHHAANNANDALPIDYFNVNSEDPALDVEHVPWESAFFSSDLVDYAATFDNIFKEEKSLQGLMERFREIGARQTQDAEEMEGIHVAKDFVERMERQSPLALRVVHQLMTIGSGRQATLENCMEREKKAQLKLLGMSDFENWAKFAMKQTDATAPFTGWKHKNVAAVTAEEVDEIIS